MMLYLIVTKKDGTYLPGYELFTSETNSVNVRFTSDIGQRRRGFTLDVKSISCPPPHVVQEIVVAAGEVVKDALITDTESDGLYPNRAWQEWQVITDENKVNIWINVKRLTCYFSV